MQSGETPGLKSALPSAGWGQFRHLPFYQQWGDVHTIPW